MGGRSYYVSRSESGETGSKSRMKTGKREREREREKEGSDGRSLAHNTLKPRI